MSRKRRREYDEAEEDEDEDGSESDEGEDEEGDAGRCSECVTPGTYVASCVGDVLADIACLSRECL